MEQTKPTRKRNRLQEYSYSTPNAYFITVCTHNRRNLFWETVGAAITNQMKGAATRQAGFPLWQKGFYDHVIRSESDYLDTWNYIYGNPMKLESDTLYI